MKWDVFISHASEENEEIVLPLAAMLRKVGIRVWLDTRQLTLGDSLRQSIDNGLAQSRFGVVIISKAFLSKMWPMRELDALMAKESRYGKVILPIWHGIRIADLEITSPTLAGKLAVTTDSGLSIVVEEIRRALDRSSHKGATWPQHIEFSINPDSGTIAIKYPVKAKELEEIDNAKYKNMAKPVWANIKDFIEIFLGVIEGAVPWSRLKTQAFLYSSQPDSEGICRGYVEIKRTLFGIPIIRDKWKQLWGMLHLGDPGWHYSSNHLGNNRFDIYIVPYYKFKWWEAVPEANDDESRDAVLEALISSKSQIEQLLSTILNEDEISIAFNQPVWEEQVMPDSGADAFHVSGLIIESCRNDGL